ncbi:lysA protein [Enterobacter roggenkampii]|uniref:DNZ54_00345 family protein n=1 Tax=Enterobacter roggenkampii TaxID=1812935 RepID=UPI001C5AFDCA|nr:DNZ54_00345 family protein [Enterobacter roggenkampii]MBW4218709.1 lysA protein [Enterobacter roggenkampii]HDR2873669.1 lysA protein [Enterobacter roggenkampii]
MKKFLCSLVLNAVIVILIALGLSNPASVAVNVIAAWAVFGCVVLVVSSLLAVISYEDWVASLFDSSRKPKHPELFRSLIGRTVPRWRRAWSLILFVGIVLCLLFAGWVFLALIYSLCVLVFNVTRIMCRVRIKEAGLCPESL